MQGRFNVHNQCNRPLILKKKNHMIISADDKKCQNSACFHDRNCQQTRNKRKLPEPDKKFRAERLIGETSKICPFSLLLNIILEVSACEIRDTKKA